MKTNWQTKKLGEVCKIGDGNHSSKYPKKSEMVNKGMPFIRANNLVNGHVSWDDMKFISKDKHDILKKGHLMTGDVLFTNRGEIGKIAIVGADFNNSNLNSQIAWFRCTGQLNNKFLFYFLSSPKLQDHYLVEKNGVALQQFTIRQINDINVPIPSILEQKRLVKILDEVFADVGKAKENAEKNLQNAKELFESYLQSVFANPDKDWKEKKLGEAYDVRDGTHDSPRYQKEGYALITSKNLKKDELDYRRIKYISEKDYKKINDRSKVHKGDILFAMIGTIGNPVVVKVDPDFAIKNVALFKVPKEQDSYFLKYFLDSKFVIDKMTSEAKGTTQKFVGLGYLRDFKIRLPKFSEQKTIVAKLDALSAETKKLEAIYKRKLADLEELKKSVLKKAFSGEL